mmetsp:Transcript_17510/g.38593  ORF Transcript_17510/g.38593 Transcript_17510/m.38593 type:complete len:101 (-) Transcript_17510:73-375(-)
MTTIKKVCDKIATKSDIFKVTFEKIYKLEEFKQVQKSSINAINLVLTQSWPQVIEDVITSNLKHIGKGWFNLMETNKESYEFSKLKKFLTIVKYMMQDSI